MCNFKSGIIFKNRVVIAEGENDSHSDLLDSLGIEDTIENAMRMFVRAELLPKREKMEESSCTSIPAWWSDPKTWRFHVDQDILPDWFMEDQDKYKEMFIVAVEAWCKEHVLIGKEVGALSHGYYLLEDSHVEILGGNVVVNLINTKVENMYDNSSIESMWHNSRVGIMSNNSRVGVMWDGSSVGDMISKARVGIMLNNSRIRSMFDDSSVGSMFGNARVEIMYNNASIGTMSSNSKVGAILDKTPVQK